MEDQTFHQSVSKVMFTSQLFGLLPVSNVLSNNVQRIRYSWLSLHTLYTAIILTLNGLEFLTVMNLVLKEGLNFHTSEHVYFWRLATKWPFIMRTWRQAEEVFLRTPYRLYATFNMKRRINGLGFIVVFGALVEHSLLLYNAFNKSELERTQCHLNGSYWESFYKRERVHFQMVLPFRIWFLPFLEWTNLTLAYPRSFTDAFLICVSIGLAARFRQIYLRIDAVRSKAMPVLFWTEIRQHYLVLKQLVRLLNAELSTLILLAFSNNMYFICFQLFNSFKNIGVDRVAVFAFWYSLVFAIIRTILTLYIAATVNDFTKKILSSLRDVPSRSWCIEIQRFSEQLSVDVTALSGNGFFFLTRRLILAMASTIVTYELLVMDVINEGTIQVQTDFCGSEIETDNEATVEMVTLAEGNTTERYV